MLGTLPSVSPFRAIGVSTIVGGIVLTVMLWLANFASQRLGEPDHPTLRRDVVRHVGRPGLRARGGDGHDPAPAGVDHVRDPELQAGEGSGQVHREDPVPLLGRDVGHRVECLDAGIRDHDGDRTELLAHRGVHLFERAPVDDVDLVGRGAAPLRGELGRGRPDPVAVDVEERDRVAVRCQPAGDPEADARGRSGHHRHPAAHRATSAGVNSM